MASKKMIAGIGALGLLAGVAAYMAVSAYFADSETGKNVFTIGKNTVEVHEEFEPPEDDQEWYKKAVQLKNDGPTDEYVRVYLDFSEGDIKDKSFVSPTVRSYADNATEPEWYSLSVPAGETITVDGVEYESYFDHLPEHWVFIPESDEDDGALLGGYFYYDIPVKSKNHPTAPADAETVTSYLIGTVKTVLKAGETHTPYDIIVYAESVQIYDKDGKLFVPDGTWTHDKDWSLHPVYTNTTAYKDAWKEYLSRK